MITVHDHGYPQLGRVDAAGLVQQQQPGEAEATGRLLPEHELVQQAAETVQSQRGEAGERDGVGEHRVLAALLYEDRDRCRERVRILYFLWMWFLSMRMQYGACTVVR